MSERTISLHIDIFVDALTNSLLGVFHSSIIIKIIRIDEMHDQSNDKKDRRRYRVLILFV